MELILHPTGRSIMGMLCRHKLPLLCEELLVDGMTGRALDWVPKLATVKELFRQFLTRSEAKYADVVREAFFSPRVNIRAKEDKIRQALGAVLEAYGIQYQEANPLDTADITRVRELAQTYELPLKPRVLDLIGVGIQFSLLSDKPRICIEDMAPAPISDVQLHVSLDKLMKGMMDAVVEDRKIPLSSLRHAMMLNYLACVSANDMLGVNKARVAQTIVLDMVRLESRDTVEKIEEMARELETLEEVTNGG